MSKHKKKREQKMHDLKAIKKIYRIFNQKVDLSNELNLNDKSFEIVLLSVTAKKIDFMLSEYCSCNETFLTLNLK
jgi:hypothetical protein